MNRETKQVREFMVAAKQELPDVPTMPSLQVRILRAKLMLEECLETIHDGLCVEFISHDGRFSLKDVADQMGDDRNWGPIGSGNLEKLADGCADTKVVTIGTELACGIDGEEVFDEVHRSNMSKFIDGSFREDGKYVKGPSYSKPDIAKVLKALTDYPIRILTPPEAEKLAGGQPEQVALCEYKGIKITKVDYGSMIVAEFEINGRKYGLDISGKTDISQELFLLKKSIDTNLQ